MKQESSTLPPIGWGFTEEDLDDPKDAQFDVLIFLILEKEKTLHELGIWYGLHPYDHRGWFTENIIQPLLDSDAIIYNTKTKKYSVPVE